MSKNESSYWASDIPRVPMQNFLPRIEGEKAERISNTSPIFFSILLSRLLVKPRSFSLSAGRVGQPIRRPVPMMYSSMALVCLSE